MTREEAMTLLKKLRTFHNGTYAKAIDMAIEALSAEPTERQNDVIKKPRTVRYKLHNPIEYVSIEFDEEEEALSANCTTEKPNDEVEQGNDVVVEPTDLISRADAIEAVEDGMCTFYDCDVLDRINAVPSADRPSGEWTDMCACSICGFQPWYERDIHTLSYCPNCGAKMRSGGLYYTNDGQRLEWKPVSEGLPQSVGSYIVTCQDEQGGVYVDYDYWTVADEFKYNRDKVTAWIPFPKPYCGTKIGSGTR